MGILYSKFWGFLEDLYLINLTSSLLGMKENGVPLD